MKEWPKPEIESGDKLFHFFAYFALTLLWFKAFSLQGASSTRQAVLKASVLAFVFGIIIEILQGTLTNTRALDGYDVLANTLGTLLAGLVVLMFKIKGIKNF